MDIDEYSLDNIVERLKKETVRLDEIDIPLKKLIRFAKQYIAINLCYAYIPEGDFRKRIDKNKIYQILNKSIVLYTNETIDMVIRNMYSIANSFNILERKCQSIIRIEYVDTAIRYLIVVTPSDIKIISSTSLNSFNSIADAADYILNDIISNRNIDKISSIKMIYPINGEELKLKIICRFNKEILYAVLINSIVLCLLIKNL